MSYGKYSIIMTRNTLSLAWPMRCIPRIDNAGHFPLVSMGFSHTYQSASHALHLHEYEGTIDMDGRKLALRPGTVTISPAGGCSSYDLPRAGRHWCIHFYTQTSPKPMVQLPLHVSLGDEQSQVAQRMAHIASLHARAGQSEIALTAASLALQELLLLLAYQQPQSPQQSVGLESDMAIDQLLQIIHRGLDQPLRIAELAEDVQLSQNYLARRFRQRMGMTIPRYILQARIQRAQLLLKTTDLPVKHIAAQVGMPDAQHFNKQFRQLTGMSPSVARAM